ncbi:hypothetical protein LCGC14_0510370 [marine sediment metagenome]|uniref:Uncharacterized protein n=1 Tax=marine sediment metagenome TaxID=412755 RepID=A0A0F9UN44_9ZZZZ
MAKRKRVVRHRWAHIVKNPKGYIDPYKVVVGPSRTFHSWHKSRGSAVAEASRINKSHSGYIASYGG